METIGLRYFNVFGKNQDPNGAYAAAIPKFIGLLKNLQAPTIFGDGKQTRDFTYIKNVILANELALHTNNKNSYGNAYNVACGSAYSLLDAVNAMKVELAKKGIDLKNVSPVHVAERKGDILNLLADIQAIKRDLGYGAHYSFQEGISEYIATCF